MTNNTILYFKSSLYVIFLNILHKQSYALIRKPGYYEISADVRILVMAHPIERGGGGPHLQ
jgi:hypothetical protein